MKQCGYEPGVVTVNKAPVQAADLSLVSGEGLKEDPREVMRRDIRARLERISGWTQEGLAAEMGKRREWVGKMLGLDRLGKIHVPDKPVVGSMRAWHDLDRAVRKIEVEDGHDAPQTAGQDPHLFRIRLHGVYGVAEAVFESSIEDADETRRQADLLLRGQHEQYLREQEAARKR